MPDVWYENPPGTAPAQGLYSHAGLSHQSTIAFVAGQLSVGGEDEDPGCFDPRPRLFSRGATPKYPRVHSAKEQRPIVEALGKAC